jgi:hypothetical protein
MLQKFKVTSCAFILCLFGLTLITVPPVFADATPTYRECSRMQAKPDHISTIDRYECYMTLLRSLQTPDQLKICSPTDLTFKEDWWYDLCVKERHAERLLVDPAYQKTFDEQLKRRGR